MTQAYLERLRSAKGWKPTPGVAQAALETALGFRLPSDFAAFAEAGGEFEGLFGKGYLRIDPPSEIAMMTGEARLEEFHPGFVLIGGNGGGEWFCIDTLRNRYVMIPAIGGPEDAVDQGRTLEGLLERVYHGKLFEKA